LGKLKKVDKSLIKDHSAPIVPGKETGTTAGASSASPAGGKGSPAAARPGPMSMQEEMAAKLAKKKANQQ
jgi:hypothetical protein